MSQSVPEAGERLPWDSDFFGVAIARVARPRATVAELASAVAWAERSSVDCLYFLADAADRASIAAAERNGFGLVDIRVTLDRRVPPPNTIEIDAGVRPAKAADAARLGSIARVSHRNTRFHRDGNFDPRRADEMYAVWIERAVNGELADAVWVVDTGGGPLGYLAASRSPTGASIGLVAIEDAFRGQGHGERLLRTALRWAADHDATRMSVVTQGHQASALQFYERSGFAARHVQLWYHYWSRRRSTAGSQ
jgi:GNAT superfamily N-acetyltransferase